MKETNQLNLTNILEFLESYKLTNYGFLEDETLARLNETIQSVKDEQDNRDLQMIKDFRDRMTDDIETRLSTDTIEDYYDIPFIIGFNGTYVEIPFNADSYDSIVQLLNQTIDEW